MRRIRHRRSGVMLQPEDLDELRRELGQIDEIEVYTKKFTKGKRKSNEVRVSGLNDEDFCPVCLDEYVTGDDIVLLHGPNGPKHHIHAKCFSQMSNKSKCPMCRQSVHTISNSFGKCVFVTKMLL